MRIRAFFLCVATILGCAHASMTHTRATPLPGNPTPGYPDNLVSSAVSGVVIAEAIVDTTGSVIPSSVRVTQPLHPSVDSVVSRVLKQWRFSPAREDGRTVQQLVAIPFTFKLRAPTSAECQQFLANEARDEMARTGKPLGQGTRRSVKVVRAEQPRSAGPQVRTVAEFFVDSTGTADVGTLVVTESSLSLSDAAAEVRAVLPKWRFQSPNVRGCPFGSIVRHEFIYPQ